MKRITLLIVFLVSGMVLGLVIAGVRLFGMLLIGGGDYYFLEDFGIFIAAELAMWVPTMMFYAFLAYLIVLLFRTGVFKKIKSFWAGKM